MVAEVTIMKTFSFESTEASRGEHRSEHRSEQAPELVAQVARFREDMDALMRKHRHEINACIEKWFGAAQGLPPDPVVPFESRPPQPVPRFARSFSGTTAGSRTRGVPEFRCNLPGMVTGGGLAPIVPTAEPEHDRESLQPEITGLKESPPTRSSKRRRTLPGAFVISDRRKVQDKETQSTLERYVYSRPFEWFSFTIISLNCVFIGFETQFNARQAQEYAQQNLSQDHVDEPAVFWAFQILFCVLFVVELGLRWWCAGLGKFFTTIDTPWNIFDVFVVGTGLFDLTLKAFLKVMSSASSGFLHWNIVAFRVMRIIRVVRVLKVIRVVRFFRELRMMVSGILTSVKSMIWVCIVFCTLFYMFGIVFTNATTTFVTTPERHSSTHQELLESFGTLDTSVLSLFMAMSGGNDWVVYYQALLMLPSFFAYVFIFFILLSVFVVTNVVIGIFVETAMQSNKDDREVSIRDELAVKQKYCQAMRHVFEEIKSEDSDTISLAEFEERLQDERMKAYFRALKLDVTDARTLFTLLDHDRSAEICLDEFIAGCYRLQGVSRNLDMKIMQQSIKTLLERVYCMEDSVCCMSSQIFSRKRNTTASWTLETV